MEWKKFNFRYFWMPMMSFTAGIIMGLIFPHQPKTEKQYPIKAKYNWSVNHKEKFGEIECDSINGDTLWKDGNKIVNGNIINITFND